MIVRSDEGVEGYASGDALPDRALLERLLVGVDPLRTEVVRELCETVDFHHARPWTVEVAVWDLAGRALGVPCWQLLGGRSERLLAYASSARAVDADERVRRCVALRDAGVRAVKLRFHHDDWREDVADRRRACATPSGRTLEIMVDANHGWRMPGDLAPALGRRDRRAVRARARAPRRLLARGAAARRRSRGLPRRCARLTDLRIAAGEMVRTAAEARELVVRGGVDVIQMRRRARGRRDLRLPPRRSARRAARARRGRRTPGPTASASSPTSTSRWPSPAAPTSRCPTTRRRCRRRAATGCCRRRSRSTPTASSRRRRARVSASFPTSTPSSAGGSVRIRAVVRREPPAPDRVSGARRRAQRPFA